MFTKGNDLPPAEGRLLGLLHRVSKQSRLPPGVKMERGIEGGVSGKIAARLAQKFEPFDGEAAKEFDKNSPTL